MISHGHILKMHTNDKNKPHVDNISVPHITTFILTTLDFSDL